MENRDKIDKKTIFRFLGNREQANLFQGNKGTGTGYPLTILRKVLSKGAVILDSMVN